MTVCCDEVGPDEREVIVRFLEDLVLKVKNKNKEISLSPELRLGKMCHQEGENFSLCLKLVDQWYKARTVRNCIFSDFDIFGEPAWDILLDLYISYAKEQRISVSSACIASRVPSTTALRWITHLEKRGLIHRNDDCLDKRRSFVEISEKAKKMIEETAHRARILL